MTMILTIPSSLLSFLLSYAQLFCLAHSVQTPQHYALTLGREVTFHTKLYLTLKAFTQETNINDSEVND